MSNQEPLLENDDSPFSRKASNQSLILEYAIQQSPEGLGRKPAKPAEPIDPFSPTVFGSFGGGGKRVKRSSILEVVRSMNMKQQCDPWGDDVVDQTNLAEPMIPEANQIMSLDNEYRQFKEKQKERGEQTQPIDIYLENCKRFTKQNMNLKPINVTPYKFTYEDLKDPVMDPKLLKITGIDKVLETRKLPGNYEDQMSNDQMVSEINRCFVVTRSKIFTEIIFHEGKQILVVKSWQQVLYSTIKRINDKSVEFQQLKRQKQKKKAARLGEKMDAVDQDNSMLEEIPPGFDNRESIFHLKTIQFYDSNKFEPIDKPTLVEIVYRDFSENRIYDTSITQFKDKVYFFRRHFTDPNGKLDQSLDQSFNENSMVIHDRSMMSDILDKDMLQLYSFKLNKTEKELNRLKMVKNAYVMENLLAVDTQRDQQQKMQLNSVFSKEFGQYTNQEYSDEAEFLESQYISVQEYIRETETRQFTLIRLRITSNKMESYDMIYQSRGMDNQSRFEEIIDEDLISSKKTAIDQNKQVQILNHIMNYKDTTDEVNFVVSNHFSTITIKFNMKDQSCAEPDIFKRSSTDIFQKIWNTNGIHVQKQILKMYNEHGHMENIEQYFFLDSRNNVQILFPNYEFKIDKTQITDMIYDSLKISPQDFKEFKKINIVKQRWESDEPQNIIQSIRDLKEILNCEVLDQSHQVTFCEDPLKHQVLYISCPMKNRIDCYTLKKQNYEKCTTEEQIKEQLGVNEQDEIMGKVTCTLGKVITNLNDKFKVLNRDEQKIEKTFCHICDEDHREEYISRKVPKEKEINESLKKEIEKRMLQVDVQRKIIKISDSEKDNHVILDYTYDEKQYKLKPQPKKKINPKDRSAKKLNEDFRNKVYDKKDPGFNQDDWEPYMESITEQVKVMTYKRDSNQFSDLTQMRLISNQATKEYQCFVFAIISQDDKVYDEQSPYSEQRSLLKKSYFFITKTKDEMEAIFKSECKIPLVGEEDEIQLIKSQDQLAQVQFQEVRDFQFREEDEITNESAKPSQISEKEDFYTDIKLSFIQVKDIEPDIFFIPFIYQDKGLENNTILVYDFIQQKMSEPVCINPSEESMECLHIDEQGYNCFSICKSSRVEPENPYEKDSPQKIPNQFARYQVFTLFSEKVGIISCDEFLISNDYQQSTVQAIGKKQIIISRKAQQMYDWNQLKNFKTIPYIGSCQQPKGCVLMLQVQGHVTYINLQDQEDNNLYNYSSQIVLAGQKMFGLSHDDQDVYAMVVSSLLRKKIIKNQTFDRYEAEQLLSKAIQQVLSMRIPDLKYLILNTFEDMSKQGFFQAQEILHFKSICDITILDSEAIENGIKEFNDFEDSNLNGSIFDLLTREDPVRKTILARINFAPKISIITKDLNFTSTIERAIRYKQFKSANMILSHTLEFINTAMYQELIMNDLPVILDSKQVPINEFFQISESDRKEREQEGFCNFEISFRNQDLPLFSNKPAEYITAIDSDIEDFHNYRQELAQMIIDRDNDKIHQQRNIIVDHTFIDFRPVIIGEKLRTIQKFSRKPIVLRFDNLYYANWMQKCGDSNQKFYLQESVQKLIDYQWELTCMIQKNLFMMYFFFFLIPICITLFSESEEMHVFFLQVAIIPAFILFFIECIQIRDQGISYFMGWNLIDFSLFGIFLTLQYFKYLGKEDTMTYMPETKLGLVILAFMKLLFFVRIFEDYGFLVQMIRLCVLDLIPFIISYVIFLLIFTICFVVLKMEIDPEVVDAQGLNYSQKMFLQVFRTAIGELGMPVYTEILAKEDKLFMSINIFLIWIVWFFQTFFMLIIMLNFLIAVITSTYERVMNLQKIIAYQLKAELNHETFSIMTFFGELPEYKFLVLSTRKKATTLEDDQFSEIANLLMSYMFKENKEVKKNHEDMNYKMSKISEAQDSLVSQLQKGFDELQHNQQYLKKAVVEQMQMSRN